MAEVALASVKAEEAIRHIRGKVGVPTRRWDDLLGAPHAKGFTVAGATKAELVNDFHTAIVTAIEDGQSISQFRAAFDEIVAKHGWEYKGSRGWRTRTIYDNNLRSAHMAGRWEQIQRTKSSRPYLVYMTVGDARVRDLHRKWHGVALPIDDPWWDTHYPPNDYGCRCYVVTASAKDLERMGIVVLDQAPPIETTRRINARTGEDYGEVPVGIGTGWNYNVGKAWLGPDIAFGEKLVQLPRDLRSEVTARFHHEQLDDAFAVWARRVVADPHGRGATHTMGWLDNTVLSALEDRGAPASTAAITISDHRLRRMRRDAKVQDNKSLSVEVLEALPRLMREYKAVFLDKRNGGLVFVLDAPSIPTSSAGKVVVEVNFVERGEVTNSIRSAGVINPQALGSKGLFELVAGQW